ncbi:bifunctional phosphoribosyl-AMP cyclohydrolase/phosphoribosyl-ATP diphosphatase HisIE [Paenibacillus melissococcoides]|uniref:Histidine biosynthesis bifunctional protein HisIE n=1 Tax=Paenibacillus melissococcoides TaxID=2912268 RepID=A0ABN8U8V7_9BACL|nr:MULTISPECIES: bifunctional phosphoribosyl-AMP cyclohydrolase/phosphoribosyl-ATP diphosphatase HisIE [Paenibacillus]MEB9893845.1 bifunctional phosphoribosyl-AMP cyclohydrolase/phosphoribosyl-ATP diphosphatase HisIE [Bacillus cereus]CAH8247514.1 bifunctional phosphoribosyl-AMP cyclohydrolase/phosphoribosyl-ATP diphosphatase HisIE [Paenibacillus melissococcoides]CAH8705214.1 bifunctional phosphoribosyl-AMP cyclohydrolase/phosphoribosyl-ATP diphosphatase HisIE [Paenibacillus melissococcoides]CAH
MTESGMTAGLSAYGAALADRIRWDGQGLVPAIVQDASTREVLMMAYMSRESLLKSCETGETIFWSRSRQELWHKGATSGNTQRIVELAADCDGDTLLIQVIPNGPACHTGTYTCFDADRSETAQVSEPPETLETLRAGADAVDRGADDPYPVLAELEQVIADREEERPEGAYTTYLFDSGIDKILKKIGEESAEVLIAAKNGDNEELTGEAADLLFHLLVLLRERKLPFAQVLNELQRRHQGPRRDAYNAHGKIKPSTES